MAIGASWGSCFIFLAVAIGASSDTVRAWSELSSDLLGVVPWLGIIWLLLVFPTGRLAGTLERITGAGVFALGGWAVLSFTLNSADMDATGLPSPLAVPGLDPFTSWVVSDSGFIVVFILAAAALSSLVTRWRASLGVERHQFRWLLFGAAFYVGVLAIGQVVSEDNPLMFMWIAAGASIPAVIGVAVLRYRLYDIDRVISRTVTYAVVVGLLGGAVALLAAVVGVQFESPLVVAATTLAVAAVFNPLRRRVQRVVDRRFNRSRYDAERVMDAFSGNLRGGVGESDVVAGWVEVVTETMEPSFVGVWVKT